MLKRKDESMRKNKKKQIIKKECELRKSLN